jgi:hypothetical protein
VIAVKIIQHIQPPSPERSEKHAVNTSLYAPIFHP